MSVANPEELQVPPGKPMAAPALEGLSARIARWPWWAIIILVGLVLIFYSLFTSEIYRRALRWEMKDPQLSTNRIASVLYEVRQPDGSTANVSGTLIKDDNDSVTVITVDEVRVTVPRSDLETLTCSVDAKGGPCPVNSQVTLVRKSASGTLIGESLGNYTLRTNIGDEQKILKIATSSEVRTPERCVQSLDGGCEITLTLKPDHPANTISGLLLANDPDTVTVQPVPPQTTTFKKADILQTVKYVPAQCALNNLAACNEGPFLTIWITLASFVLAIILGLAFGLMRVSSNVIMFNIATVYVEVIRGIPLLVILLIVGFAIEPWFNRHFAGVSPYILAVVIGIVILLSIYNIAKNWKFRITDPAELYQPLLVTVAFGVITIVLLLIVTDRSKVTDLGLRYLQAAIVGLAIGYGAFLAELFRAGIQSIGKGQMEASRSLGMTYVQAMRFVVLPQAFRVILPPLGNDFIALLKDTSLVTILTVPELTQKARLFASDTYKVFEAYLTIAVLYLCMTLFLSLMVRVVERRTSGHR